MSGKFKVEYYVPREKTHYELETERELKDFEALELVAETESLKRVPYTWLVWFTRDGQKYLVNRTAAIRHKAEAKKEAKS